MPYANSTNSNIEKLVDLIDSEYEMTRIPVRIEKDSKLLNCYVNVAKKVKRDGGRQQYGWAIVENEFMCEAEHHCVWENKLGDLVDITPKDGPITSILFIPDDRHVYKDGIIDNVRMNITGNIVVDHLIAIAEMSSYISENGTRLADDRVRLSYREADLNIKYDQLGRQVTLFVLGGNGPESPCYCKSGKTYEACHGLGLFTMIRADMNKLPQKPVVLHSVFTDRF
jgi:hypothetical protein